MGLPQLVNTHLIKMKYVLLGMAGVACLNCISRPDYNLFLFLFLYYHLFGAPGRQAEENSHTPIERLYTTAAYGASLIIDVVWLIVWGRVTGIVVIIFSSIEVAVKALIIGVLAILIMSKNKQTQPLMADNTEKL